jgi:hypothetical protein
MLSCLLIFFANRQETDRVVLLDKKAAPGKHPRIRFGVLFCFKGIIAVDSGACPGPDSGSAGMTLETILDFLTSSSNIADHPFTGRMLKKPLLAGCSKTLRYKAAEIPRSETYTPVRRNDEG